MTPAKDGIDETRYSLMEHLTELRERLLKSVLAVLATTGLALFFAPELLEYTVRPLAAVLRDRNRVEAALIHSDDARGVELTERLGQHAGVRFQGRFRDLQKVRAFAEAQIANRRPLDLLLVSVEAIGEDDALVSDLLEGLDPAPDVVYLVAKAHDARARDLQLEGASLIPDPPRNAALNRAIRRAAATSGKAAQSDKLVVLSPLEPFFAYLKVALVVGLFLACPIWLFQAWRFVAPGLYSSEKMVALPCVLSGSVLFLAGGLFAYFGMFPIMFDVLVNDMMPSSLVGAFTVDKYMSLLLTLTIAFGVVFELPLALALLALVGVVTPGMLRKLRKYAIVGSFIFAAVITPTTDPLSLFMMAIPLVVFYEVGIVLAAIIHRRREEKMSALGHDVAT